MNPSLNEGDKLPILTGEELMNLTSRPQPGCHLPPFGTRVDNLVAEFRERYGREPEYLVLGKEEYLLYTYHVTMNKHIYFGYGGFYVYNQMEVLKSAHNNKLAVV